MAITAAELIPYLSASNPTDDSSTTGGAIATTGRPDFTQFAANAVAAIISDGADTRTVTVTGRLATGAIDTEVLTANGAVEVVGAKTWERILSLVASATDGSRTISVRQGSGGTVRATIPPTETTRRALFYAAASAAGATVRYEKIFWKNTNGSLTLTSSTVTLTADPSAKIKIGLATSVNDTATIANRLAVPSGPTFVDDSVAQSIPSGGGLAAGAAIGVWIELSLTSNDSAYKSTFTTQLQGNTV